VEINGFDWYLVPNSEPVVKFPCVTTIASYFDSDKKREVENHWIEINHFEHANRKKNDKLFHGMLELYL
jgi:hypothetical protein